MAEVKVTVGGKPDGKTLVAPYSHTEGLQYVMSGGVRTNRMVLYSVPRYSVTIQGGNAYSAVRFGLVNKGTVPVTRVCDAGLSAARNCTPTWVPSYSPHSFDGNSRPGAWRLIKGKGFLIHEGANTSENQVGGSLGCVEILDGKWNDFLGEIEKRAGVTSSLIADRGLLKVAIEYADYPTATLVS